MRDGMSQAHQTATERAQAARIQPAAGPGQAGTSSVAAIATPAPVVAPTLPFDALDAIVSELRSGNWLASDPHAARLQVQLLHNRGVVGSTMVRTRLSRGWQATSDERAALPDLDRAVQRLLRALRSGEHIIVYGDYDADGITSCALLTEALRTAVQHVGTPAGQRAEVTYSLPTREDDGRGLNRRAVAEFAKAGASLIVTTDCGTSNVGEVAELRALGIDVIITDHHPPHGVRAPADALVNPACGEQPGTSADLAGVGVAFRLAEALYAELALAPDERDRLQAQLLDLVALGTIGDVVPLSEQSWVLARAGLARLRTAPRQGLRALLAVANVDRASVTERDISFALGPRLNSASRLGHPQDTIDLLLCTDAHKAEALAARLDAYNLERRARVETMIAEARAQVATNVGEGVIAGDSGDAGVSGEGAPPPVIFVVGEDWPIGMLGLVASRLAEDYHVPAFALGRKGDEYRGSGRAPEGYDLGDLLAARAEWFSHFGGHAQAAGFTITPERLRDMRSYLTQALAAASPSSRPRADDAANQPSAAAASTDMVDCVLPLARATLAYAGAVADLSPFGSHFPEPRFLARAVRLVRWWRTGLNGQTLRLVIAEEGQAGRSERTFYWPRQGALADELGAMRPDDARFDLVYALGTFRARMTGRTELSLRAISLHRTASPDA